MKKLRHALLLIFSIVYVELVGGFLSVGPVHNIADYLLPRSIILGTGARHDDMEVEVRQKVDNTIDDDSRTMEREVDNRRMFLLSIICTASIIAVSADNANAASSSTAVSLTAASTIDTRAIISKAATKALGGGKAGASAAIIQVLTLMWLRTTMNYQYRFGGTLSSSLKELYNEGGIPRLYQGLPFALVQGPLTRFGDTAANVGVLALLESIPETANMPIPLKTATASISAGLWRIFLMPIDTSKTVMQVEGSDGLDRLKERVIQNGPAPLYQGAIASAAATAAGHFPWFTTYNILNEKIPVINKEDDILLFLVRSAVLGLSASCVSDIVSNSLRVIKTTKQTAGEEITYQEALALVLDKDGLLGLFGRGLQTRLLTNAIQGALFSVLFKYFQETQKDERVNINLLIQVIYCCTTTYYT
jgi:hypothetical protein